MRLCDRRQDLSHRGKKCGSTLRTSLGPLTSGMLLSDQLPFLYNRKQRLARFLAFELNAGEYVLKLVPKESVYIDMIAVTGSPAMFD